MHEAPPSAAPPPRGGAQGRLSRLHRWLFYGWRFRDADTGTDLERALAARHNEAEARWLPLYALRWSLIGAILLLLEVLSERLSGDSLASALLLIALIYVVLYLLLTAVCWAFLQRRGRGRRRRA